MKNKITQKNDKIFPSDVVYEVYNALMETARSPAPRVLDKPGLKF